MKFFKREKSNNDEGIWMSVSDLMSGLMIVFLFISICFMSKVSKENIYIKKEQRDIQKMVKAYESIKVSIYNDLQNEFKDDVEKWAVEIDKDGTVRFLEPEVFFHVGNADLKTRYKDILYDFFPRYIDIVYGKYKDNIQEIRIEGYTSSEWGKSVTLLESYFYNMELSQDRTRNVLSYVMNLDKIENKQKWLIEHITANGMSYSHRKYDMKGVENKRASRRVEFKIRTNADEVISNIIEKYRDEEGDKN